MTRLTSISNRAVTKSAHSAEEPGRFSIGRLGPSPLAIWHCLSGVLLSFAKGYFDRRNRRWHIQDTNFWTRSIVRNCGGTISLVDPEGVFGSSEASCGKFDQTRKSEVSS